MKLPLRVFIVQSFEDRHLSLSLSGPALTLDVKTQRQNATDQPQEYTFQLSFDGGFYVLGIKSIEPRQTR